MPAEKPIRLCISGACGRMGKTIAGLALADSRFEVAGALESPGHTEAGRNYGELLGQSARSVIVVSTDLDSSIKACDVVIEFTLPEPTLSHAGAIANAGKPLVIGTTGLDDNQVKTLGQLAQKIPIVFSPNMSVGVNVLFELAKTAAALLGPGYDAGVFEMHHNQKKDAPSGTAKRLIESVAQGKGAPASSIQAPYFRGGSIVGDHTVVLAGQGEYIELRHIALDRSIFAQGALRAAAFLAETKKPGLYSMADVLKSQ